MGTRAAAAVGRQWTSSQGIKKVEEMMSRAIIHQEDLWGLLVKHSVEHAPLDDDHYPESESIPPLLLKALKVKLENSLDWCHLALCRLKEIIAYSGPRSFSDEEEEVVGVKLTGQGASRKEIFAGRLHDHVDWSPGSFIFSNEAARAQTCTFILHSLIIAYMNM